MVCFSRLTPIVDTDGGACSSVILLVIKFV